MSADFSVLGLDPLSVLIFAPMLSGLIVALLPAENKQLSRWVALTLSLVVGAVAIAVFIAYQENYEGIEAGASKFLMESESEWFEILGSTWHLGVDGISVAMVLLTAILVPLAILVSWEVDDRANIHLGLLLMFEGTLMGVFCAMDLMVFFLFYELSLVPIYFLIDQWGGKNRKYAATKFMIYSVGGTLGMLLATQLLGWTANTFDIQTLTETWPLFDGDGGNFLGRNIDLVKGLAFAGFMVAFAIKVPVWPFHTWLPDAHGEAPTAGSMLLAGVMLKLGAYGFIRLVVPFFPDVWISEATILGVSFTVAGFFAFLAMLGIVLGAFAALGQHDIKRLVAYSSVNHMGFVAIGIAVMALAYGRAFMEGSEQHLQDAVFATNGAVMQMFNHGLSSAAMFLLAGAIYHKTHTRDIREYGGLWVKAPIYGGIFIFTSMASLGLPGLNGFIGEFLVVRGTWPVFTWLTVLSMIGLLFTGSYILKGIRATLHGPFNLKWRDYKLEIELREFIAIAPLMVLMLVTGLYPNWILPIINDTVAHILGG